MKINWQQGLFRVWIVLSIVWWLIGVVFGAVALITQEFTFFNNYGSIWQIILTCITFITVPFIVYVISITVGRGLGWIIEGFEEYREYNNTRNSDLDFDDD